MELSIESVKAINIALVYNVKPDADNSNDYDDRYAEWDTWETINAIGDALNQKHNVTYVEADLDSFEKLRSLKPDFVFNISEGANGESREAQLPAILDMLTLPYSGSDPWTLSTCLNKIRTKEILGYYNIATPAYENICSLDDFKKSLIKLPAMFKPVHEGSSKGIFNSSLIKSNDINEDEIADKLDEYGQPFILEEYLPGKEFTAAVLGNGSSAKVLPIIELNFDSLPKDVNPIYSYEAKWILDGPEHQLDIYHCPADIDDSLEQELKDIALKTFHAFNCKDWCRIDLRLDSSGTPNVIEVNPLPGVLPDPRDNSCFPKAAAVAGLNYDELINSVLETALKRYNLI